jgi:putative colanic acid biosynthesis acetyltransferase WcaF
MLSRYEDPSFGAKQPLPRFGGPTFALKFRLMRLSWMIVWLLLARWTPPPMRGWRNLLLTLFGARLHATANVHAKAIIWWPANLSMGQYASMGPGVICYNVAKVTFEDFASVSQRAHLCTGSHNVHSAEFELIKRPIHLGANSWIAAEAFVGPGVAIGDGAVLGARSVAAKALAPWTIYAGNPARIIGHRSPSAAARYPISS